MVEPIHILVVDDDDGVRAVLRQGLEADGFVVNEVRDRDGVFHALETSPVDLITLDLILGKEDGLRLSREIRSVRNVPIIIITGRGDPIDRVAGLEQGADDYITKPFHIREALLRVRNVLARYGGRAGSEPVRAPRRYAFEGNVLDPIKRELRAAQGELIELTETECGILELFLKFPGRVLSRDEIWRLLRGHKWSPLDRTIDVHVARLRRKVEPLGEEPKLIRSVRGVGYVFAGEVRPI